jgi:hypothetical protein
MASAPSASGGWCGILRKKLADIFNADETPGIRLLSWGGQGTHAAGDGRGAARAGATKNVPMSIMMLQNAR